MPAQLSSVSRVTALTTEGDPEVARVVSGRVSTGPVWQGCGEGGPSWKESCGGWRRKRRSTRSAAFHSTPVREATSLHTGVHEADGDDEGTTRFRPAPGPAGREEGGRRKCEPFWHEGKKRVH